MTKDHIVWNVFVSLGRIFLAYHCSERVNLLPEESVI